MTRITPEGIKAMLPRLPSSRREWALTGILLMIIAVAGAGAKEGLDQHLNIRAASRHTKRLKQQLAVYPEYRNVVCSVTTADNGAVVTLGYVANYEQRRRLRILVSQSKPPTNWRFQVKVKPDAPR